MNLVFFGFGDICPSVHTNRRSHGKNRFKKDIRDASVAGSAAFDIIEYASSLDVSDVTGLLLTELALEMIAGVAYRRQNA
jgi:arginase family enzyme